MEQVNDQADPQEWHELIGRLRLAMEDEPAGGASQAPWRQAWGWEPPDSPLDKVYEQPILGNKQSMIYHTPDHPNYGSMNPKNREYFDTAREAEDAGYRAAKNLGYETGKPWETRSSWQDASPAAEALPGPAGSGDRLGRLLTTATVVGFQMSPHTSAVWARGGDAATQVEVRIDEALQDVRRPVSVLHEDGRALYTHGTTPWSAVHEGMLALRDVVAKEPLNLLARLAALETQVEGQEPAQAVQEQEHEQEEGLGH